MSFVLDMSIPSDQLLLNLINDTTGNNFTFDVVYFDPEGPKPTNKYGKDTKIVLIAKQGAGFQGRVSYYYNRIKLHEFFEGLSVEVDFSKYIYTEQAVPDAFEQLGINLDVDVDTLNDVLDQEAGKDTLRISRRSYMYAGYLNLNDGGEITVPPLSERVLNVVLDGFYIPE